MFTSHKQLIRNSGKKGVDRREFLQELINEFYQSASLESQEQVLANLANFAYDPLNYHYIRELRVIDLFVKSLESRNPYFVQYSLKGLCNCVNDPLNQHIIYEKGGINRLKQLVQSSDASLVKDSLTTLNFLSSSPYHTEILVPDFISLVSKVQQTTDDQYLKNLAQIFLEGKSSPAVQHVQEFKDQQTNLLPPQQSSGND